MDIKINKITIKNFKSIKDITINIDNLTVMVGKNGSGKTNIIEAINFNKSLFTLAPMKYPFTKWWGYTNLVYNHNTEDPVSFSFDINVEGHKLYYEYEILDNNGLPNFISEHILLDDYIDILRKGSIVEIKHLTNAIDKLSQTNFDSNNMKYWPMSKDEILNKISQIQYINGINSGQSVISLGMFGSMTRISDITISSLNLNNNMASIQASPAIKNSIIMVSLPFKDSKNLNNSLYPNLVNFVFFGGIINNIFNKIITLGPIDYKAMKNRVPIAGPSFIADDGTGFVRILYQYFLQNRKLPPLVEGGITSFFPGWELNFEAMPDGTITLFVKSGEDYFYPPGLPLGFYKLIIILELIEQKPEILLLDELENSFHEKMIEYVLDAIKARGIKTIISTHSPLVVDLVDLKHILIVKMLNKQTVVKHIKNSRQKSENLIKEGITPSESLLYGDIDP